MLGTKLIFSIIFAITFANVHNCSERQRDAVCRRSSLCKGFPKGFLDLRR